MTQSKNPTGVVGYPRGLERKDVPIDVVRKAFHESGMGVRELARRLKQHHSGVGRTVRGWKATQYIDNADGQTIEYDNRYLTVSHERALRYIRAMELDPRDYGLDPAASPSTLADQGEDHG